MRRHIPSSYSFHLGWRTQKRRYSFVYGLTSSSIHQIGRCTKCVICCIRSATVYISVNDVNEYAPKFNQPSYVVNVDEGRPADKIIQVEANENTATFAATTSSTKINRLPSTAKVCCLFHFQSILSARQLFSLLHAIATTVV